MTECMISGSGLSAEWPTYLLRTISLRSLTTRGSGDGYIVDPGFLFV